MVRQGSLLAALVVFAVQATAFADDTHHQDYPLGGRAVGLGGAFIALANDPSGILYNPAGLVDVARTTVQISSNLYGFQLEDTFFSGIQRVADLDTVFADLNVIPSTAGFTSRLGDLDSSGRAKQAYGLGVFVPTFQARNVRTRTPVEDETAGNCREVAYERSLLDRTFFLGSAYSRRVDDRWRVGIGGFASLRTLRDQEQTDCFSGGRIADTFASSKTTLDLAVLSLFWVFGVKADLGDGWHFGATVSTPSLRIYDFANFRWIRTSADAAGARIDAADLEDLSANHKLVTSLRTGFAYVIDRTATYALDVSLYAPTRYTLFKPPPEAEVEGAVTLVRDIRRRMIANVNVGGEWLLSSGFSISSGFYTNFSSAPGIPGQPGTTFEQDRLPHIHTFGGSFVLGFFGEHTLTRVGLTASAGSGTDVVPQQAIGLNNLGFDSRFVKVDVAQLAIYFFVASTFRY